MLRGLFSNRPTASAQGGTLLRQNSDEAIHLLPRPTWYPPPVSARALRYLVTTDPDNERITHIEFTGYGVLDTGL